MSSKKDENSLLSDVTIRFNEICNVKKIKPTYLYKNGVGAQQTVYDVLKGKQKPGIDFLMNFLGLFPDIDGNWLITGEGSMYKESQTSGNIITGNKNLTAGGDIKDISKLKEPSAPYNNCLELLEEKDKRLAEKDEYIALLREQVAFLKEMLGK